MAGDFLGSLLGYAVGDSIFGAIRNRELVRKAKRGVFLCGFRVVSGRHSRLTGEWLPGEWHITPGQLTLGRILITVRAVEYGSFRKAGRRERLDAGETLIVPIRTETAHLEWSVLRSFKREALAALALEPIQNDWTDSAAEPKTLRNEEGPRGDQTPH